MAPRRVAIAQISGLSAAAEHAPYQNMGRLRLSGAFNLCHTSISILFLSIASSGCTGGILRYLQHAEAHIHIQEASVHSY